ncbi:MAG: helix-turn-helix transcriptional regulator [Lachnospiraceae bacterium]|nr:helix-turn-helix transcriptional regulator [Lachnospiraceae bacterium]
MNFGAQIKKMRKERKLTQEQMAKELGVSRQAVSNWENDRNLPDIEMLILISRVFHISLDNLF